jgi:hypothetical protein
MSSLDDSIAAKRADAGFMTRLRASLKRNKPILDKLAEKPRREWNEFDADALRTADDLADLGAHLRVLGYYGGEATCIRARKLIWELVHRPEGGSPS